MQRKSVAARPFGIASSSAGDDNSIMRVSLRAEQAIRALIELADADDALVPSQQLVDEQGIPARVLNVVMTELLRAGLVRERHGSNGGFRLSRPAAEISLSEVVSAIRGL